MTSLFRCVVLCAFPRGFIVVTTPVGLSVFVVLKLIGTDTLSRVFKTDGTPRTVNRLAISTVVSTDVVGIGVNGIKPGAAVFLDTEPVDCCVPGATVETVVVVVWRCCSTELGRLCTTITVRLIVGGPLDPSSGCWMDCC